MKNYYIDLIKQSYQFPQNGFELQNDFLTFHGVSLASLIQKYGTPFRITYLPKIGEQIQRARNIFNNAILKNNYQGKYNYAYCTKCNHFFHVIKEALSHQVHLETSSPSDIDLVINLFNKGIFDTNKTILHNGFKTDDYIARIFELQALGFENSIIILDSISELSRILKISNKKGIAIGIRMAINERVNAAYNTSRLGIRYEEIIDFVEKEIQGNDRVDLKMLHFFVDSGIKDSIYYWGEFQKAIDLYSEIKKIIPSIDSFNIGGGFPIQNHLGFKYDFELMAEKIIQKIKATCTFHKIKEPDLYSEFGQYTVGESGAIIFQVLEAKQQNDTELWYIIDNSLLNTIPDAWAMHEKFILLPINKWKNGYQKVHIGGISCDHSDYYNSEDLNQEILLPKMDHQKEPLYIGFFHTAAYQDAVSGYGGIKHCLVPSPKHIIIDRDTSGNLVDFLYSDEQSTDDVLRVLGY